MTTPMRKLTRHERAILAKSTGHYHSSLSLTDTEDDENLLAVFDRIMENLHIASHVPEDTPVITRATSIADMEIGLKADRAFRESLGTKAGWWRPKRSPQ